jgi:hypothetical protein
MSEDYTPSDATGTTLFRIGNFVGLKIRDIFNRLSLKASQVDLDKLPRFYEAPSEYHMLTISDARSGDFCLRTDMKVGYRLVNYPIGRKENWRKVFGHSDASVVLSYNFPEGVSPIIIHNMEVKPVMVSVIASDNRLIFTSWNSLDNNRIQLNLTEATSGVCSLTFQQF